MYNGVVANTYNFNVLTKMIDTNWEIEGKLLGKQKLEVKIVKQFYRK